MDTQRVKTLIINIATGGAIIAVLITAYAVFIKEDTGETANVAITEAVETAEETIIVGEQVSQTLRELDELGKAVSESVQIFKTRAFRGLENFSTEVSKRDLGRDNPFELTAWKLRQNELSEASANRRYGAQSSGSTQSATSVSLDGIAGSLTQTASSEVDTDATAIESVLFGI